MALDPSTGMFWGPQLPPPFPPPSTFASSGARTEIDPKTPLLGVLNTTVFSAAQTAAIGAYNALNTRTSPAIPGGTVIGSFAGVDLAAPYAVTAAGLPVNLPVQPNKYFPALGAPLPDLVDTSIYVVFALPSNVVNISASSTLTIKMGLCIDPNLEASDSTGGTVCFGASAGPLISGTSTVDNNDLPPDAPVVTGALPTVPGTFYSFWMLANTTSIIPGSIYLLRITRRGGSSRLQDTHRGRLLLLSLDVISS